MCMPTMTRRLQILVDDQRYAMLEREATETGRSVAEVIRDAIDARYQSDLAVQEASYRQIASATPMPVEDWATIKSELADTLYDPVP